MTTTLKKAIPITIVATYEINQLFGGAVAGGTVGNVVVGSPQAKRIGRNPSSAPRNSSKSRLEYAANGFTTLTSLGSSL